MLVKEGELRLGRSERRNGEELKNAVSFVYLNII